MRRAFAALTLLALTAGCGTAGTRISSGSPHVISDIPGCPPVPGETDTGAHDTAAPTGGGTGFVVQPEFLDGSTARALKGEIIAVLKVVSRGAPQAVANDGKTNGSRPATTHAGPTAADPYGVSRYMVIRTTRFAVVRLLRGSLPSCLDLDVLGGTAGAYQWTDPRFPASYAPGDELLGLFSTTDSTDAPGPNQIVTQVAPYAHILLRANPDGTLTLPFGGHETINVNTWTPPSS